MSKFTLSRRAVLRGAGSIAIALPWLEIMQSERRAHAAEVPARRFLAVYTPGGTVLDRWEPAGSESDFVLSPILSPLEPVKSHLCVLGGLDMKSAIGEQSQSGMVAWLTGTPQRLGGRIFSGGPSIDQVIATEFLSAKPKRSLQMAVRWGTGRSHGQVSPVDIVNFENGPEFSAIAPALDPVKIWQDLFGAANDGADWDKSILDFVDRRYAKLAMRLGGADQQRLEAHLSQLRELEKGVALAAQCRPVTLLDTSDYDPLSGLNSANDGSIRDLSTDAAIPKVGKLMMDMTVMALACDMTAVGTLQWSDSDAQYTLPWLDLPETHQCYENGCGYRPAELTKIYTWYAQQHAYLLAEMAKVDMGGHSLLDESVVFFGSEVQNPADHTKTNMPFLLAGSGGGLRAGRWLRYDHLPHNNLLVSILNLFGAARTTFGDPMYCTGPLDNLV